MRRTTPLAAARHPAWAGRMSDPLSDFSQPDADFDPQKTEPQNHDDAAPNDDNPDLPAGVPDPMTDDKDAGEEVAPEGLTDDEADRAVRHD